MPILKFNDITSNDNNIKVIGVGGGGSNAVDNMYREGIKDVDFIIANTDAQALERSSVPVKIQLGERGKGAGNNPDVGRDSATETADQLEELLSDGTEMVFVTAGMGGGTGTGAAPVISSIARNCNILTVGIVTMPFAFEGPRRKRQAENGILELRKYVDTILIIMNDKIRELHQDMKMSEAFKIADNILTTAAKGIAELVTRPGYINVDFEDVKSVMKGGGKALMSSATAEGDNRALDCAEAVLNSPLLADDSIRGAENILLYLASSPDHELSINEMNDITDYIKEESGFDTDLIFGTSIDDNLGEAIRITLVATGFDKKPKTIKEQPTKIDFHTGKILNDSPKKDQNDDKIVRHDLISDEEEEDNQATLFNQTDEQEDEHISENLDQQDERIVYNLFNAEDDQTEDTQEEQIELIRREQPIQDDINTPEIDQTTDTSEQIPSGEAEDFGMFPTNELEETGNFSFKTRKRETQISEENNPIHGKAKEKIERVTTKKVITHRPTEKERDAMERVAAYKRKNAPLNNTPSSGDENDPEYAMGLDKNNDVVIKRNNGYINKSID